MRHKESCKVAEYIYDHVCTARKVGTGLRSVYIMTCASQGKLLLSCKMCISSRVHHTESCYKVAEWIYHHECITNKVVIKLWYVYIITCASQGKLVKGCGVYISSRVYQRKLL